MLISMTGFASRTTLIQDAAGNKAYLTFSLKTVNSRFFEATCKFPYHLQSLEPECVRLFKQHFQRGHVTFVLQTSNSQFFRGKLEIDFNVIGQYVEGAREVAKKFQLSDQLSLTNLFLLPHTIAVEERGCDAHTKQTVLEVVGQLVQELLQARLTEGAALYTDIKERCSVIKKEIDFVRIAAEKAAQERAKKLAELAALAPDPQSPEATDAKRSAMYHDLDRGDIHEELTRFDTHLISFIEVIDSKALEKGRRLDFTLQELGREINTISAKVADAQISAHGINIKVELEKIREQVQNIV